MYFHKSHKALTWVFPCLLWQKKTAEKEIFLTFDDGPIPEVTEFVLENLALYQAKATFFCVGDNIKKHPDIFAKVVEAGHTVANHTFHHLNGWQTQATLYWENIENCTQIIQKETTNILSQKAAPAVRYFRPPYGKMTPAQVRTVAQHYQIVMWDVLTGDFDAQLSPQACLEVALGNTEAGSIVTFHDSLKARRNLEYALPLFLQHFHQEGYLFSKL
ncbi:polysaccharide deacetylase family protein [Hugenholtzia roseola]|uniref:polysaccharide deacetylase family protein n=1 Tax=Hugenholtzia roseola TaxID=1002 RepID=UPI00040F9606|nr:polysaccharide deacetylase family protein [Hugenholtzia roseola]